MCGFLIPQQKHAKSNRDFECTKSVRIILLVKRSYHLNFLHNDSNKTIRKVTKQGAEDHGELPGYAELDRIATR